MDKMRNVQRWLWILLFFTQIFMSGALIILAPEERGANGHIESKAAIEISHLSALQQSDVFLTREQQKNLLQYCSGLERTLASQFQYEDAVSKNIGNIIVTFICFLAFSALIQIAIIFIGRDQ